MTLLVLKNPPKAFSIVPSKEPEFPRPIDKNVTFGHDSVDVLSSIDPPAHLLSALLPQIARGSCDADRIRKLAREQRAWANNPPKRNRKDLICFSP